MISLGDALLAIKADENWIKKLVIGGFVGLAVIIATIMMETESYTTTVRIIGAGLYLLFGSFYMGFIVSSGNKMLNSDSNSLAEWKEDNLLVKGLKFLLSYIVYTVAFTILFTLLSVLAFLGISLILWLIYFLVNLLFHIDCSFASPLMTVILSVFTIIFVLYLLQFMNAAYICYYKNLRFRDIMSFKKQFRMIKENPHASWTLIGKEILYVLLFILSFVIAFITIIGILAIPFIYFAAYIVITNLYAQYGRQIDVGKYL